MDFLPSGVDEDDQEDKDSFFLVGKKVDLSVHSQGGYMDRM